MTFTYVTVATLSKDRWFDLDAVRTEAKDFGPRYTTEERTPPGQTKRATKITDENGLRIQANAAGAPPLDWHDDNDTEADMWSYITVATLSANRWFDLDAVRNPEPRGHSPQSPGGQTEWNRNGMVPYNRQGGDAGAPPLDWHDDNTPPPPNQGATAMSPSTVTYHIGDVRDRMAAMPDHSVDLIVTSPPFLALRSYLPADHPDKHREIGSEPTPAAFLQTLLELTAEWRRLLTPTGSLCVELGDTYSGANGWGDNAGNERYPNGRAGGTPTQPHGPGWPLAKSLCGIPTLYTWSLAYGQNLLTGQPSPAGQWRIRNLLVWTRPNPPVGALGDKFRPATSFVTVAATSAQRWFDLDGVRNGIQTKAGGTTTIGDRGSHDEAKRNRIVNTGSDPAGAPPLDWHHDDKTVNCPRCYGRPKPGSQCPDCGTIGVEPTDDWQPLHRLPTAPYPGAHYATYPLALPRKLIEAMCPRQVCQVCGEPRRRIVDATYEPRGERHEQPKGSHVRADGRIVDYAQHFEHGCATKHVETLGWTDCRCNDDVALVQAAQAVDPLMAGYRPGHVLDPFAGSGTTLLAAALCGRDATGIDLDPRNVDLTLERLRADCHVTTDTLGLTTRTWHVDPELPGIKHEHPDQQSLFG